MIIIVQLQAALKTHNYAHYSETVFFSFKEEIL